MDKLAHKLQNRAQRASRVRAKVSGTPERPRLSVFISNQHITAQIIDDTTHKTLAYASTVGKKTKAGTPSMSRIPRINLIVCKKTKLSKPTHANNSSSVIFIDLLIQSKNPSVTKSVLLRFVSITLGA